MKSSKTFFRFCFHWMLFPAWIWGTDLPTHWVTNDPSIFFSAPVFDIQTTEPVVEKIHWQISTTPEFDWLSPDLKDSVDGRQEVTLSSKAQKSLRPGETYFFRFKTEAFHQSSSRSEPFSFSISSPVVELKEYQWQKSAFVDEATWQNFQPYLLPGNHPIKAKLDQIFSNFRALSNRMTMKMAGFQNIGTRSWDKAFVGRHPELKGYVIKAYLDDHLLMDDRTLVNRIIAAEKIRQVIVTHGFQAYFKVPRKWLYQLPDFPGALPGLRRKSFILIAEDMDIVDKQKNEEMFRKQITEKHLQGLYYLLNSLGLSDSVYIKNIPFSNDNKIAFVDTERHELWPVPFKKLTPKLSSKMKNYWEKLTLP